MEMSHYNSHVYQELHWSIKYPISYVLANHVLDNNAKLTDAKKNIGIPLKSCSVCQPLVKKNMTAWLAKHLANMTAPLKKIKNINKYEKHRITYY